MTFPLPIALVGPPNSGKSTLFNALTGGKQKVGNYPGVTVEKRFGTLTVGGVPTILYDLPGIYDLKPQKEDEWIALSILTGNNPSIPPPRLLIVVLDGTQPERSFHFLNAISPLPIPKIAVFTKGDLWEKAGVKIDIEGLSREVGFPAIKISVRKKKGIEELKETIAHLFPNLPHLQPIPHIPLLPYIKEKNPSLYKNLLKKNPSLSEEEEGPKGEIPEGNLPVEKWLKEYVHIKTDAPFHSFSRKLDNILLHPFFGLLFSFSLFFLIFQSIYLLSDPLVTLLGNGLELAGNFLKKIPLPPIIQEFLMEGVLGGVGNVVSFLPSIAILFFWIAVLEEWGYLSRVAFLLDHPFSCVGLSGKSVIPLLSGFACAVPAILSTRTIEDYRVRTVTILLIPLMTCSARLPVYTLLIGTFVPSYPLPLGLSLPGIVFFCLYCMGILSAFLFAFFLKKMGKEKEPSLTFIELPMYHTPSLRNVGIVVWQKILSFLKRAGTIIFSATLILWILLKFPYNPSVEKRMAMEGKTPIEIQRYRLENSAGGKAGKLLEPFLSPLGYDWKITLGLIGSFSAREVMVATLGTIYAVENPDPESPSLRKSLKEDRYPDGKPVWNLATALSLLVFFVYALQCISTVVIIGKETGSFPLSLLALLVSYGVAYGMSFLTFTIGKCFGWDGIVPP